MNVLRETGIPECARAYSLLLFNLFRLLPGVAPRRRPRRQGLEGVLKPVVDAVVRPVRAPLFAQTPVSHPGAYEHLEAERIDCAIRVCEPQRARGRDAGYFG